MLSVNAIIEEALATYTKGEARPGRVTGTALAIPIIMGLAIPAIASWGPIRSALSASLRDALDVYRQKMNEVHVTMLRLAELGLEPWQVTLGWFLVIAGFSIYYILPLSFIFDQLLAVLLDIEPDLADDVIRFVPHLVQCRRPVGARSIVGVAVEE